jgi:hypothetical protein
VWSVLGPVLTDAPQPTDVAAPVATAKAALATGTDGRVRFSWSATDAAPSSGLASFDARVTQVGGSTVWSATTGATSQVLTLSAGRAYTLTVRARDVAGHLGAAATAVVAVPLDDTALSRSGSWSLGTWSADYRGSHAVSRTAGSKLSLTFTGRSLVIGVVKAPTGGYVDVYLDGRRTTRLDTWSTTSLARQQVRLGAWSTSARHTLTLVVVGAHRTGSADNLVRVDSATVTP